MMRRAGFTIVELLVVITLIGILANIAVPLVQNARYKATASSIIADYNAIRYAAHDYFAESGEYPRSRGWGVIPPELVASLPVGFQFKDGSVRYRWRRWSLPNGLPRKRAKRALLAVQVRSKDRRLIQALAGTFKGSSFGNRRKITLVIEE